MPDQDAIDRYLAAVDAWIQDPATEPAMRAAARDLTGDTHDALERRPPDVIDASGHRWPRTPPHAEMHDLIGLLLDR